MSSKVRLLLKVVLILFGVVIILWLGVAAYVTYNKKKLLETVTAQLNDNINGKLTIESMEPALIKGFPGVSVSLKNVVLRDSLYETHKHDFLNAKEVFVALNVFALLGGNTEIEKLSFHNGKVYLFTDSLGNSNNKIFTRGSTDNKKKGKRPTQIKRLELRNVLFTQENKQRNKFFNFDIRGLTAKVDYNSEGWKGNLNIDIKVNSLAFNTRRGSFIKNQVVKTNLDMNYIRESGVLKIPVQAMKIGTEDFKIGGNFVSTEQSSDFKLSILAPNIELKNVIPLLARNIASKLSLYKLSKPISAEAVLQGSLKKKGDPKIFVTWEVKDNQLTVLDETIKNCSFTGYFNNEFKPDKGFNDPNSVIGFANFKGTYYTIPFRADTIRIVNLRKPIFEGRFQSAFALEKLNAVSGSPSFHFHKGTASLNLFYRAPYNKSNSVEPFIHGALVIKNAVLNYHPRNIDFSDISGIFRFKGQDLFLQNLKARTGSSSFALDGSVLNFLNLYYTDPKQIKLDLHVKSPKINLGEFLVFLGKRKTSKTNTAGKSPARLFNQLDKVLAEANVHLDLAAGKLTYRRFEASNVHSSIVLKQSGIDLRDVSLNHAEGSLKINGDIDQSGSLNKFNIDTRINNVNISKLFYAFENFGQDALSHQNLRGSFSSNTRVSGSMRDNGQIVPKSFQGFVKFDIRNGAVVNFEPMQRIGKFAFPNRDFSNIMFTRLGNTFDIKGNTIRIQPMYIESSVLNLYVEGIYGMPTGTDIALRIPLRNPKRDIGLSDSLKRERFDNGIVINLRGQDDENGNVKFKLGKKDEEKDKEKQVKAQEKEEKLQAKKEKEKQKEEEKVLKQEEKKQQR